MNGEVGMSKSTQTRKVGMMAWIWMMT